MSGRLTFLEHCTSSKKDFPELSDDANYQKDYDSLKEQKLGELALILPCPQNEINSSKLNDPHPPKNNAKKHSRKASQENKKTINSTSNKKDGFTSPKKFANKLKLTDPVAGTTVSLSTFKINLVASLERKLKLIPRSRIKQRLQLLPPKIPPFMFKHKKENYKNIIKDLNKDFLNCNVKLAGKYLKIFTTNSDEHRTITDYLDEKREEFYVIQQLDSRPQKIVFKGLPDSTEIGEIQADLTS
ncbi:hypothetical protein TNCV_847651 [Trichonephila clavipes]|uniref:Uncharacterized protein n=1 Tax=Trichonephila clavipes TaxID=2585209 RepID=A0A8X6V0Z6_TRICX|nr:hypothetical protein TNCV_847651 [Trichonephila clavipes]